MEMLSEHISGKFKNLQALFLNQKFEWYGSLDGKSEGLIRPRLTYECLALRSHCANIKSLPLPGGWLGE